MPLVRPDGWSQERAERLQEAHRDLLRAVKDKPVGTEAGRVYRPDMSPISPLIVGKDADQQISLPPCPNPHIALHSHPSGLTFSQKDVEKFIWNFDMTVFTAVGNDGSVYLLQKTEQYDAAGFAMSFGEIFPKLEKAKTPNDYANIVNDLLKGAEKHGTRFIARGESLF